MRKNNGNALPVFAVLIIVLVAAAYFFQSGMRSSQPIVTVDASVTPGTFKVTDSATLKIQSKNQDQAKAHTVMMKFVTNQLVRILIGQNELPTEGLDIANYTYTLLLQPGQTTNQPFGVKTPTLPVGIQNQEFYIRIEISVDGVMQNNLSSKVTFTVESQ